MDKRTLFFVFLLTLALFFVNIFFEQRNAESTRQWKQQNAAKNEEKIKKLNKEVEARTVKASTLPVTVLYVDADATQPLAMGVETDKAIMVIGWSKDLPNKAYAKPLNSEDKATPVSLASTKIDLGEPVIYRPNSESKLRVAEMPEFGKYDLQLLSIENPGESSPKTILAEYVDGNVQIPAEKISALKGELKGEPALSVAGDKEYIVLIKAEEGYLPVAIYRGASKALEPLDHHSDLAGLYTKQQQKKLLSTTNQKSEEKFYVLETPYQQLVFSNYGGALAEINLPFESEEDKFSVVKEIEFDRDMVEQHPYNAYFPAHAYSVPSETGKGDFVEIPQGKLGGYYPLLRRDLIEKDKRKSIKVQPRFYATNIVSEYPETAELIYEVKSFTKDSIVFETVQNHRRITKTYSVSSEAQAPYSIDLTIDIEGDSRGLWLTSGIPEVEWISGGPAPALKYRITRNKKPEVEAIDLPNDAATVSSVDLDWLCNSNGFLGLILDSLNDYEGGYRAQKISGKTVPSRLVEIDQQNNRFDADAMPGYMLMLPIGSAGGSMHYRVFAGPFADSVLKTVDKVYSDPATGYNPDYIACQSFHGWFSFISEPFAKFLFVLMNFFHSITGSWAFSIILLTVALRIMLYPLNAWSTKSMVRMQQIAPEVTAIQEKYKKDPKKVQLEIMNLYRERGVNPVSGCFPLLIQMPFLIGMFDLLKSTFELRGASFIPGWIDNLTSPDVLFSWSYPIPFIGNQFHLLPILLGVVMLLQQKFMSTAPKDPALMTEQQRQQQFMGYVMAIVFTVMFYNFPSGLNIYWLSSMLLGMLQQWWTQKTMKKITPPANAPINVKATKTK